MKTPLKTLLFSLLLFPLFCIGQTKTSLDFVAGIDLGYRNLNSTNDDPSSGNMLVIALRNDIEIKNLNLRFGFNINQKITDHIFLKTGLRFATVGYKSKKQDLIFGDQVLAQLINPDTVITFSSMQLFYNYLFFEVPLIGRYEFNQKKFSPFVELGVAPSFYLKSRNKQVLDGETKILEEDGDLYNYSKIHLVGVLSFGASYQLSDGTQLFAQPTFRYHLTRLVKDVPIKENLWNIGLELGLRKRLR